MPFVKYLVKKYGGIVQRVIKRRKTSHHSKVQEESDPQDWESLPPLAVDLKFLLPPEIWEGIFELSDDAGVFRRSLLNMTQTSKDWRAFLIGMPRLWRHLLFIGASEGDLRLAQTFIPRARGCNLYITINFPVVLTINKSRQFVRAIMATLLPHTDRWRVMNISAFGRQDLKRIMYHVNRADRLI